MELFNQGLAAATPPGLEEETATPEIAEADGNGPEPVPEPAKKETIQAEDTETNGTSEEATN